MIIDKNIKNEEKKENYPNIELPKIVKDYVPKGCLMRGLQKINDLILNHSDGYDSFFPNDIDKYSLKSHSADLYAKIFGELPNSYAFNINGKVNYPKLFDDIAKTFSVKVIREFNTSNFENDNISWWVHKEDYGHCNMGFYLNPGEKEKPIFDDSEPYEEDTDGILWFNFWILQDGVIMECRDNSFAIAFRNGCFPNEIFDIIKNSSVPMYTLEERKLYLVAQNDGGLYLETLTQLNGYEDDTSFYNDDFKEIDVKINEFLETKDSGLVILHGEPGTGKTSYIRNLMKQTKKKVIYMPSGLMSNITTPTFLPFALREMKGNILIIEDCEQLLRSRDATPGINDGLINILDITDGILGDSFNTKIICTYNTNKEIIDNALKRKGRLYIEYEFKALTYEKAKELAEKYNLNIPEIDLKKGLTLSQLFNYNVDNNAKENKINKIGF